MSQLDVFPAASSARRSLSRTAYILFGIGAALLICGAVTAGTASATRNPGTFPYALAGGVACAGLAGLTAGTATLSQLRQPIQVEVSPYRLVWREGKRTATLIYDEVVRVELVKGHKKLRDGSLMTFPVVRFIESDGEMMEFDVTFEDQGRLHRSRFDSRAITSTVLPYLPQHIVLAPTLDEFLRSGEVDIDLLPDQ